MSRYCVYPLWQEPHGLVDDENTGDKNTEAQIAKVSASKMNEDLCTLIIDSVKVFSSLRVW
jgi:hypothetical protein